MDMIEYYKEYFKIGGEYTMEASAGPTSRVSQILDWLKIETKIGDRILDIGCGDGYLSTRLTDREWEGIDINTSKAKCKAQEWELMKEPYPFPDESFNAIVCSEVLEHVWDMRIVHRQALRLLKPNGVYIISTPNFDWIENIIGGHVQILFDPNRSWTLEHIRHYTAPIHDQFLREAGFNLLDWTGLDAHFGNFFQGARSYLKYILTKECKAIQYEDDAILDRVIGRMFPSISHTIAFLSRKEK